MSSSIFFLSAATVIDPGSALNITLLLAAGASVLSGIIISITVFFASDPNGTRKSALLTTVLISMLAGATVGVLVVLLRDPGTREPSSSLMVQCLLVSVCATMISSAISLIVVRILYIWSRGKTDTSGEEPKRWASRSGRLRF